MNSDDLAREVHRVLQEKLPKWDRTATFSVVPNSHGRVHVFVRSRRLADVKDNHGTAAALKALGLKDEFPVKLQSRIKIQAGT